MLIYKGKQLNEPGNVDFGSSDISGIGDGTVTGAISEVNSKTTFNYQTPTFQLLRCTGTITATEAQIAYSESGRTIQICGRITIKDFVRTSYHPGVCIELPFRANKSLSFCVGKSTVNSGDDIYVSVTENSNILGISVTESYQNAPNGTLILIVPLATIHVP